MKNKIDKLKITKKGLGYITEYVITDINGNYIRKAIIIDKKTNEVYKINIKGSFTEEDIDYYWEKRNE